MSGAFITRLPPLPNGYGRVRQSRSRRTGNQIMRYPNRTIRSVPDLLRLLAQHRPANGPLWFRGQANRSWELLPSLVRVRGGLGRENALTKRFKQNALLLLPHRPETEWEWLFIMRHYGVPTRLLDWTESPLVGLYFAVSERPRSAGCLWALLPIELNQSANAPTDISDLPAFDEDAFLKNYLPSILAGEKQSELKTVAAIAARNTARSQAQLTVFTITHRDQTPIEQIGDGRHVWRYIIPSAAKRGILQELEHLTVTRFSLFPELPNVGAYAREILP